LTTHHNLIQYGVHLQPKTTILFHQVTKHPY
jgi:hypothetical protein